MALCENAMFTQVEQRKALLVPSFSLRARQRRRNAITSSIEETQEQLRDIGRDTQAALSDDPPESDNGSAPLLAPRELPAADGDDGASAAEPRGEGG